MGAMGASLPTCQRGGSTVGWRTDKGRPDASRPSMAVTAQQSHGLGGRHIEPASWGGGVRGGLDLDLVGLGWAGPKTSQVDQGHSTHTHTLHCRTSILQARSTPTMPVARLPAWSSGVLQHKKAPSCLRRPQWKVQRSGGTRRRLIGRNPDTTPSSTSHGSRFPTLGTANVQGPPACPPTGLLTSLIDNSGSHAAGSWTVRIHPKSLLSLLIQATILGSTTCSSHVPSAAARQFHA